MKRVLAGDPLYQSMLANEQLSLLTFSIIMPLSNMLNHFVFPFLSIAPPSYFLCVQHDIQLWSYMVFAACFYMLNANAC